MSYTKDIQFQADCNYINPMKDNAEEFLNSCVNKPQFKANYQIDMPKHNIPTKFQKFTKSQVKPNKYNVDQLSQFNNRQKNLINAEDNLLEYLSNPNIKQLDEYTNIELTSEHTKKIEMKLHNPNPQYPSFVPPTLIKVDNDRSYEQTDKGLVEGFQAGDFNSDNGPGEQYIRECPDEYEYCSKSRMCKKKCVNCDTNVDTSDYNDICYPGNYDGINNFGNIMCSNDVNVDGARIQLSTEITNQNSMDELIESLRR